MELDYMDGDRERQWLAQANSDLRSRLRAIEQLVDRAQKDGVERASAPHWYWKQIKDILDSK